MKRDDWLLWFFVTIATLLAAHAIYRLNDPDYLLHDPPILFVTLLVSAAWLALVVVRKVVKDK